MEEITELNSDMTGRYIITTHSGTRHMWNLNDMTYKRMPGGGRQSFDYDDMVVRINRVESWPKVGDSSFIWYDDLVDPLMEQFRISSTIKSIVQINET